MKLKKDISFFILWATVAAAIVQSIYFYPHLPNEVAVHFNASGQADNFSSKLSANIFQIGIVCFIAILFGGISYFITRAKDDFINLPNKEYWLAPERRNETIAYLIKFTNWSGVITNIFLLLVFQQVTNTNIAGKSYMDKSFWFIFISFMIVMIGMSIYLVFRFSRKKNQ
ncbi:MAG: DUF1648 domain-containing protein [Ignavibacteria bacterium]|nr:MAG: DUF1648 domain-containing protein [Ignavibacteria bacterium]